MLGCGSRRRRAAVILIAIVAAILPEIVFLVDESSCSSIKFTSPLNAITNPYVPGCLLWLFQFLLCSSIWGKYFHLYITQNNSTKRDQKQWKELAMRCFSSRKIDTYSCMSTLVVSTIRRKKIDHGISVCFQGELSVIQLNSPFFLLVLLRSVLIAKKKRSLTFFFLFFLFLNSWEDIRRNVSFNYL